MDRAELRQFVRRPRLGYGDALPALKSKYSLAYEQPKLDGIPVREMADFEPASVTKVITGQNENHCTVRFLERPRPGCIVDSGVVEDSFDDFVVFPEHENA